MSIATKKYSNFQNWVGDRWVADPGSNAESKNLPFQSWRPFKEAFAPEIVHRAVSETPGQVANLIDPFGGSGTSALASQFIGVTPSIIEVNPYLADLIEAKLTTYNVESLTQDYASVVRDLKKRENGRPRSLSGLPPTFVEPGLRGQYIFSKGIAQRLAKLLRAIEKNCGHKSSRLFRLLTATLALDVSNVIVNGKGRRYRQNWQQRSYSTEQVDELFQEKVLKAIYDISRYGKRPTKDFSIIRGDSRQPFELPSTQDIAVFSPPYPNSFDYTDVYNIELWLLGYLASRNQNQTLRNSTLRSHVQVKREYSTDASCSPLLYDTYNQLSDIRNKLWSKDIPEMIVAYFTDLSVVIKNITTHIRRNGRIYCVVGDSQYAGIKVPVAEILTQMENVLGVRFMYSETFRSMRASPQQGGRLELPETLLVFEKN